MNRKAQLGFYLMFSVVLLMLAVFLVDTKKIGNKASVSIVENPQLELQTFVEQCLNNIGIEAAHFVSAQGGYHFAPSESISEYNIPYYWLDGQNIMPSKNEIENELSLYVYFNLATCLDNFSSFKSQGYDIVSEYIEGYASLNYIEFEEYTPDPEWRYPDNLSDSGDSNDESEIVQNEFDYVDDDTIFNQALVETIIVEDGILLTLRSPVKLQKEDSNYKQDQFSTHVPRIIGKMHDYARQIVVEQQRDANSFPIGYITDLAYENNFQFNATQYDTDTVIIDLTDQELTYSFALTYNWNKEIGPDEIEEVNFDESI